MEHIKLFEEFKFEIKYGLVVLDSANEKLQSGEFFMEDIVHFVGYKTAPTEADIENLREELKTDTSFGLTEIIDRLIIFEAPKEIVNNYTDIYVDIIKNEI